MKAYGWVDVQIRVFLVSALVGGEWLASHPGCFTPGERVPSIHWIRGWVVPRAGLDDVEKRKFFTLPRLELRPLGRPALSQSLYRLRYPGPWISFYTSTKLHDVTAFRRSIQRLWKQRQYVPLKRWHPSTRLHGVIIQNHNLKIFYSYSTLIMEKLPSDWWNRFTSEIIYLYHQ
jgi:hypothetical protein